MEKVQWNSINKKQNGLWTIEKWRIIHPPQHIEIVNSYYDAKIQRTTNSKRTGNRQNNEPIYIPSVITGNRENNEPIYIPSVITGNRQNNELIYIPFLITGNRQNNEPIYLPSLITGNRQNNEPIYIPSLITGNRQNNEPIYLPSLIIVDSFTEYCEPFSLFHNQITILYAVMIGYTRTYIFYEFYWKLQWPYTTLVNSVAEMHFSHYI